MTNFTTFGDILSEIKTIKVLQNDTLCHSTETLGPRGKRSEKVANFYKSFIYLNYFLCLKVREISELFCVFCVKLIIK